MKERAKKLSFYDWGDTTATTNGHDLNSDFGRIQKGFDMLSERGRPIVARRVDFILSSDKPLYEQARPSKDGRDYYKVSPFSPLIDSSQPKRFVCRSVELEHTNRRRQNTWSGLGTRCGKLTFFGLRRCAVSVLCRQKMLYPQASPSSESMEPFFLELFSELMGGVDFSPISRLICTIPID